MRAPRWRSRMLRGVPTPGYDEPLSWEPAALRRSPASLVASLVVAAIAVEVGAWVAPGVSLQGTGAALLVAALLAVLNALRLPFTFVLGFLLVLALDAALLMLAADVLPDDIQVDTFWGALIASLVMAATSIVLAVVLGTNDDLTYTIRLTRRIAR